MRRAPDFIGLGAQRSGTSWVYSCLYEHPQIYSPVKEVHFFSRERNWQRGYEWYESTFAGAAAGARAGEFCTSYLADEAAPARIHERYAGARLIVSLRNPVDRAYSNYTNDLRAGAVRPGTSFSEALAGHPEYLAQGHYRRLVRGYLDLFPRERLLVMIYEDSRRDPAGFLERIYRHIGVDPTFRPSMIHRRVNAAHVPRSVRIEALLRGTAAGLRRSGLSRIWWLGKRLGVGDRIRAMNTMHESAVGPLDPAERDRLRAEFEDDIPFVEDLVDRRLEEWRR